jgi:RND family efflux transporter MFP subunit
MDRTYVSTPVALLGAMLFGGAAATAAEPALIATRVLESGVRDVTLPEKVGVLLADEQRDLSFEVSGRLESIANEGTVVQPGDSVAQLASELEQARLRQAELRVRDAEAELRRVEGLRGANAASLQSLEAAQTANHLRRAERDEAREQRDRKQLATSVGGVVVKTYLENGEIAMPGTRVVTVMNLDSLRIVFGVPGFQVGRVAEGSRVEVRVPALTGETAGETASETASEEFEGRVVRVGEAAIDGGHLFEVEVQLPNPSTRLRPGMIVRASIVTASLPDVLLVPLEAVVERRGESVVFFVDADAARAVSLADATWDGDRVLLTGSVPYRELVIRGHPDLSDGQPVRVDNSVLRGIRQP